MSQHEDFEAYLPRKAERPLDVRRDVDVYQDSRPASPSHLSYMQEERNLPSEVSQTKMALLLQKVNLDADD